MTWVENLILAIIEGITEYLPVSSTGHMMMTGKLMGLDLSEIDTYIISIQFGAIFAVVVAYYKRFLDFKGFDFYKKLIVGFIPAAILGKLLDDYLETLLQTPVIVGIALVAIGTFLLFLDKWFPGGVSRSAASITGALGTGMSRVAATEFSFFLAVPTLSAAGIYKLYSNWDALSSTQVADIAIGNLFSFITAFVAIKFFIGLVKKHGFVWFGWYRIVVGSLFLIWLWV